MNNENNWASFMEKCHEYQVRLAKVREQILIEQIELASFSRKANEILKTTKGIKS